MLKIKITLITAALLILTINYCSFAQQKVNWNGYLQYRFSNNYLNETNFSVRRTKFWINSLLPADESNWNYKLQAIFHQKVKFQFLLQDVLVSYKTNGFEFTAGQFVPYFSLQRKQPDYAIPLDERAAVVNALVPGAETMARDIGIELKLKEHKTGFLTFGLFNGNGANTISDKRNFLFVNHGSLFPLNNSGLKLELGYNLSYRDAHNIQFNKIFGSNFSFTGKDFRFGLEEKLNVGDFELQSEYIEAHIGEKKAYGYYVIADYMIGAKNLVTLSVEQLHDLNSSTTDNPWYRFGYAYLIKGNDIKISLDNKFQFTPHKTNSLTTLQFQYFFN